jgi:hypothetical protein
MLFFRTIRKSDGKRVENKIPIGLVKEFPTKSCAWLRSKDNISISIKWTSADVRYLGIFVRTKTDPKTVQTLLRHSDVKMTLQCSTHNVSEDRTEGAMLIAILGQAADGSGLRAD